MDEPTAALSQQDTRWQRAWLALKPHRGWISFVLLPTLLCTFYYGVIAADQYASEARFIVRSSSRAPVTTGIAGILGGASLGGSLDDVYTVQDFATSRDVLAILAPSIDLRAIFNRPEADFAARYPNLVDDETAEDFHRYFQRRVQVVFDTTTGISSLTVKAFRAEDAQALAKKVLDESEAFVNRLNQRARANAIRDAEEQLQIAQEQAAEVQSGLLSYRKRETLIDPSESSGALLKNLSSLQGELSLARVKLDELKRRAPESPMMADLQTRVAALERQIVSENGRLVGDGRSMAPKLSEYQLLELRQEFSGKQLASALGSLESARAESRRQQIYLVRVSEPSLPDKAMYPQRLRSIFIVLVTCFLLYSIARLLIAGVREHAQN